MPPFIFQIAEVNRIREQYHLVAGKPQLKNNFICFIVIIPCFYTSYVAVAAVWQ
jgi:hypothetical protein